MTSAAVSLIHDFRARGIEISRNGDRVRVEAAPELLTGDVRAFIAEHKLELLEALYEADAAFTMRRRLLQVARMEFVDPALIDSLSDEDLEACQELQPQELRPYVLCLRDSDLRQRGKVPPGETAPAMCQHCGPVWLSPSVAAVAPVVDSWPRVLGCPWCHVKDRQIVPRPQIACRDCRAFECNGLNPAGGMGTCSRGRDVLAFPNAARHCAEFDPKEAA